MTRKEVLEGVAMAVREMKMGRSSAEIAADLVSNLRILGLEIRPIATSSEEKNAKKADEHDRWAGHYDVQAAEFEAAGNEMAAENRRNMARESRERAAILRRNAGPQA